MTDSASPVNHDKEIDVLKVELGHANSVIDSNLDLHGKIVGATVTALTAFVGWVLGGRDGSASRHPEEFVVIFVLISVLLSFSLLWSVTVYSSALGYMDYKNRVLGPRFQKLLHLEVSPIQAIDNWSRSPAQTPCMFAYFALFCTMSVVCVAMLFLALRLAWGLPSPFLLVSLAGCVIFAFSVVAMCLEFRAMKLVGLRPSE